MDGRHRRRRIGAHRLPGRRPRRRDAVGSGPPSRGAYGRHRLSAVQWGTDPPAIVLLHGGSLNAHAWDAMLLHHDLDTLAIDLPGHGHSGWFDDPLPDDGPSSRSLGPTDRGHDPDAGHGGDHSLGGPVWR
jgi:pimeloyl-ACP methyl ester carboxylesterase